MSLPSLSIPRESMPASGDESREWLRYRDRLAGKAVVVRLWADRHRDVSERALRRRVYREVN